MFICEWCLLKSQKTSIMKVHFNKSVISYFANKGVFLNNWQNIKKSKEENRYLAIRYLYFRDKNRNIQRILECFIICSNKPVDNREMIDFASK